MKTNSEIASFLNELSTMYGQVRDGIRSMTFRNAANAINGLDRPYTTIGVKIGGIGGSTAREINQFIETGTSDRYKELTAKIEEVQDIKLDLLSLSKIPGVTIVSAMNIHKKYEVNNLEHLVKKLRNGDIIDPELQERLTPVMADAGYTSRETLQADVDKLLLDLKDCCSRVEPAGSWRRGMAWVHDLDIVAVANPNAVYQVLESKGYKVHSGGNHKIRIQVGPVGCDLAVCKPEHFVCCLTFWTGNKEFNVGMRAYAKSRDMRLNEYALVKHGTELFPDTEQDLFKMMGLKWVEPENRLGRHCVETV